MTAQSVSVKSDTTDVLVAIDTSMSELPILSKQIGNPGSRSAQELKKIEMAEMTLDKKAINQTSSKWIGTKKAPKQKDTSFPKQKDTSLPRQKDTFKTKPPQAPISIYFKDQ